jgi:hypothetical protein
MFFLLVTPKSAVSGVTSISGVGFGHSAQLNCPNQPAQPFEPKLHLLMGKILVTYFSNMIYGINF